MRKCFNLEELGTPKGMRFSRLVVLDLGPRRRGRATVLCRCDCGTEKAVLPLCLRDGVTKSCGCLKLENPGYPPRHGMAKTPEYRAWVMMKNRCSNVNSPAWPNYGGRGITVCDEWRNSFEAFLAYVGRKPTAQHSIGRIDNDKGYAPGNVEWQTREQQANNQRHSKHRKRKIVSSSTGTWAWRGRERKK